MSCDICQKMIALSHDTWERIGFVRRQNNKVKVYETTITQNLLFEIAKFIQICPQIASVSMYEAKDENTNGNDLEIYLQIGHNWVFFPTQAKIIYVNSKYTSINHNQGKQITDLINYANNNNGYPLYLLYNFDSNQTFKDMGCSFASAYDINNYFLHPQNGKKKIPNFNDLHPKYAFPWFVWMCNGHYNKPNWTLPTHNKDQVFQAENWNPLNIDFDIKGYENKYTENHSKQKNDNFSPRYKIIFSNTLESSF